MKKTYKAPKYKTIDLTGEQMIAGSQTGDPESAIMTVGTDADALVKESRGNLWDEEW